MLALRVFALLLLLALTTLAREGTPPPSRGLAVRRLQTLPQLVVTPTDAQAELALDATRPPRPVRFAATTEVAVTPLTHGTWEAVPGGQLWRLRVRSAAATDLNFGFTTFWMPAGATLHVYAEEEDYVQGPYDARDNQSHGQLWTPVLPGSSAVVELFVPAGAEQPQLLLGRINRGYRDMFGRHGKEGGAKNHGACNIDAICPLGDAWRQEIRSVARYSVGGNALCTGTLVNTANGSTTNHYFLTAHHCEVTVATASSVVVYWNYQAPACGQQSGGTLSDNQSGAFLRASRADVDMTLIELDEAPIPAYRVYYAGWDRTTTAPTGAVGIHHPQGDVKSICSSSNLLTTVNNCIGTGGGSSSTHWSVVWTRGTTEPGSSGSALFNPGNHRVIGFLSGGDASCGNLLGPDCYGKLNVAWDGANPGMRLRDWLDPLNSNTTGVSGRDPFAGPLVAAGPATLVNENCAPTNGFADPGETVTFNFSLQNTGGTNTGTVVATLLATNGVISPSAPQNYGVLSSNGTFVTRQFTFTVTGLCGGAVSPTLQIQDGSSNRGNVTFTLRLGVPGGFAQNFDGVTAPALPAGWSNSASGATVGWRTTTLDFDTSPNSALALNPDMVSDASLYSPIIPIGTSNAVLQFRHWYETELDFDGCVLEISINNAAYVDILNAGGVFGTGGYNGNVDSGFGNPLEDGRFVWTGNSGTFITTTVNLPASTAGKTIRLRWRLASDTSEFAYGWNVDTVSITDGFACCQGIPLVAPQLVETRTLNNNLVFSFDSQAGRSYITEFKNSLNTNVNWTPLQTNAGDGTKKSVTNSAAAGTNRFFRVRAQ